MGQTTVILMIITILSKLFGFVRESVMAAILGTGEIKSIYVTATTIPDIMMYTVIVGIVSSYIPVYTKVQAEKGEKAAGDFTSNLINLLMVYGLVTFILVTIFASQIAKIFSPNLSGKSLQMAASFTRIMALSIFIFLYSAVIRGFLNAKGNFIDPVIPGIVINIFVIGATFFTGIFRNPYILIIGTLIGSIIQFSRFPFVSRKLGFVYKKTIDFKNPYIKYMLTIMIPIIISSAANKLSILIDKSMASAYLGIDSVAKLFYTENMLDFIVEVFTINIATITLPKIAKLANMGKIEEMKEKTSQSLVLTMSLVFPATFGMMALASPMIRLIYERHAFSPADTRIVASLLISYAPYIIFISILKIISNVFYATGDSKSPLLIILFQQAINVLLNMVLVERFGIDGIAYATSISTALGSLIIFVVYLKKFGRFNLREKVTSQIKILIASSIMAYVTFMGFNLLSNYLVLAIALLLTIIISALTYLVIIYFEKIEEIDKLINILLRKIGK
ncbi:murein biosynthesis integral membrane protein MurJ [uncultured Anaerococcus sp.]|uniref:murein biosynthesis integral membrane protein MurJ n=1 Tax=uncultured Anaerococcus sp. TaxID=293428 RepID=UPI002614A6F1|nr:murein biosynthesis integral membrane protein MurJ [uncultured Anaerococcus sp.]